MDRVRKTSIAREWAVFALSIGVGGHIVLGFVLHVPEAWPVRQAWVYGLFTGLSVYVVVQLCRSLWWVASEKAGRNTKTLDED